MSTIVSVSVGVDPILIAQQKGFFKKLGINVKLTSYDGGGVALTAEASNQEDIIHIGMGAVGAAIGKGVGLTLVGADSTSLSQFGIWVPNNSKDKSVKDLSGAKIGVSSTGGTTYDYALAIGKKYGFSVTPVPLGEPGDTVAVASGKVDATISLYQGAYTYLQKHEIRELIPLNKVLPPEVADGMVVRNAFLSSNPTAVAAYMKGWWEGVDWMWTHKKQALEFMEKTQSLSPFLANYQYKNAILTDPIKGAFTDAEVRSALAVGQVPLSKLPPINKYVTHKYS